MGTKFRTSLQQVHKAVGLAGRRPHDFTIQYPVRREFFKENYRDTERLDTVDAIKQRFHERGSDHPFLLYVHVPFCKTKCFYCNFAVDTRASQELHAAYIAGLCSELDMLFDKFGGTGQLKGIDIGGGTPTLLSADLLSRLLASLAPWRDRAVVDMPLSIESTPHVAAFEVEKLEALKEGGVERVSVGLQSTDEAMLAAVNRSDQASLNDRAVANLRAAGFSRVSTDLIFGLPDQTERQWRADLERVIALRPDAVTTYDCLYRGKGRVFTRRTPAYPPWAHYGLLYDTAYAMLTAAGYSAPYGSVNFSLHPGETGTSRYFEGRLLDGLDYWGAGNYASSLIGSRWQFAPYTVDAWLEGRGTTGAPLLPFNDVYRLPLPELMAKNLLLSLSFGVLDPRRFRAVYGLELEQLYEVPLHFAVGQGWMEKRVDGCYGIRSGMFRHMPEIRSLFYSAEALDWLENRLRLAK